MSYDPDNLALLNPAERERLYMLAEEAAEVAQIAMKTLRHGYASFHPRVPNGLTNREMLECEVGDLSAIISLMSESGDVDNEALSEATRAKIARLHTYHQSDTVLSVLRSLSGVTRDDTSSAQFPGSRER